MDAGGEGECSRSEGGERGEGGVEVRECGQRTSVVSGTASVEFTLSTV